MIWRTITLALTAALFFVFFGPSETAPVSQKLEEKTRMPDVSPELRDKAFVLLGQVIKETKDLKLPQSRIELKIRAADLLWEKDEKQAREVFFETQNELAKMSGRIDEECGGDEMMPFTRCDVSYLQTAFIRALAGRDTRSAEAALNSFSKAAGKDLGMIIFRAYLKYDPQKAFEIAQKDIQEQTLPSYLGNMARVSSDVTENLSSDIYGKLTGLYMADQNLGAKLARQMLENIKTKKITAPPPILKMPMGNFTSGKGMSNTALPVNSYKGPANIGNFNRTASYNMKPAANYNSTYGNLAMAPSRSSDLEFSQASSFLQQAELLNKQKPTPVLTETEMKELASLITRSLMAKGSFEHYQVRDVYTLLSKYAGDQIQKLKRQMTPAEWKRFEAEMQWSKSDFQPDRRLEDIEREAEVAAPEKRDELYAEASGYAERYDYCGGGNGFEYFLKIEKKDRFPELKEIYASSLQRYNAVNGDARELQKLLAAEKLLLKKIELITQAANISSKKGNIESAKLLLNEAKKLLPEKYKNFSELRAYALYAWALAGADSDAAFVLLEALAAQADRNINTAADFYGFREETGHIVNDEFLLASIELQSAVHTNPSVPLIKKLAAKDFERTLKLADKISHPEVRLFIRWHIAESLLDKEAEKTENKLVSDNESCN